MTVLKMSPPLPPLSERARRAWELAKSVRHNQNFGRGLVAQSYLSVLRLDPNPRVRAIAHGTAACFGMAPDDGGDAA
jgi:hypothetical protein